MKTFSSFLVDENVHLSSEVFSTDFENDFIMIPSTNSLFMPTIVSIMTCELRRRKETVKFWACSEFCLVNFRIKSLRRIRVFLRRRFLDKRPCTTFTDNLISEFLQNDFFGDSPLLTRCFSVELRLIDINMDVLPTARKLCNREPTRRAVALDLPRRLPVKVERRVPFLGTASYVVDDRHAALFPALLRLRFLAGLLVLPVLGLCIPIPRPGVVVCPVFPQRLDQRLRRRSGRASRLARDLFEDAVVHADRRIASEDLGELRRQSVPSFDVELAAL